MDSSPDLIDVARQSSCERPDAVRFVVGDILAVTGHRYDAILCRGVLNDLIDDADRRDALAGFSTALRPAGVLILDVRDWDASAERKAREPLFRKRVATDRGLLTFTSVTRVDRENRRLLVSERHTLADRRSERSSDYEFVMRCWTRDELDTGLRDAGFESTAYFGAYDPSVEAGSTDRLVAVAQLLKRTRAATRDPSQGLLQRRDAGTD
jgi:hypothetical protein